MESAIQNGFQHEFSDLVWLLCVRHVSKKDKSKLVKLLAKMNLNVNQKQKSSSEILKHIYGNRAGGFYNFGLVEATHKYDFKVKLFSFSKK